MKGGVFAQKVKLRDLRLEMGLTQQELADSLDMNSRYICMVESGLKPCSDKMLKKVELLSRTKSAPAAPSSVTQKDCPRCAELEAELRDARAVIHDQASALASALAAKPSPAAVRACGVSDREQKRAQ